MSDERQPQETKGEFEARRLQARVKAMKEAEERALVRLMELPEVSDPALAALVRGVRAIKGEVQASLDALNQILRSRG